MDDLISRQDVIDIIMGDGLYCDTYADKVYSAERIKNIPTVEPKRGKWIPVTNGRGGHECDQCHEYAPSWQTGEEHLTNYCPNCGARMEE